MSELDKLRNNVFNNLQYIEKLEQENKQLKEEKPYLYTNTEWEDILEYQGKPYIELDRFKTIQQENQQLKEQLENDIDRYEDTISYQLGFDKGKEYLQQRIDKAIEYIKEDIKANYFKRYDDEIYKMCDDLLEILGGKENE